MNKLILEQLKTRFEGISESVLGRIAKSLAKTATTEEQAKQAADAVTLQQIIDVYADSRATEASLSAVKNYEAKHGLKDGQAAPVTTEGTDGKTGGAVETPAWAKTLIEANKALTERLNKMEGERTTATRKQRLGEAVKKLPEALRKPYDRIDLTPMTDEQFEGMVAEVGKEADGLLQQLSAKGAVFRTPATAGKSTNGTELSKEQVAAINQRSGVVAKGEQPF